MIPSALIVAPAQLKQPKSYINFTILRTTHGQTCMEKNLDHHPQRIHNLHDLGQSSWSIPRPNTASPSSPAVRYKAPCTFCTRAHAPKTIGILYTTG